MSVPKNMEGITKEYYEHAKYIWKHSNMLTMREYHDLYLATCWCVRSIQRSDV